MKRNLIKKIVSNKYFIAILIFLFVVLIVDSNNLIKRFSLMREKQEIEEQIATYDDKIENHNRKLKELQTSKENLEKFAREEYYMKHDNEDVFVIEEDK